MRFLPALAAAAILFNLASAQANDGPDWLSDPNELPKGVVTNDNVGIRKDSSAMSLLLQADRALKSDNIDRAIELIKRSLDLNMEDLDAHMSYATALERKLATQTTEDPEIFNKCVREWLAVLRNKYGEEKNETLNGVGLPGFNGKFYADDERQVPARNHLMKLTGSVPKVWETDNRWLAKVERHGESSVSGKMVHNAKDAKDASSDKTSTQANEKASALTNHGKFDPYPDAKSADNTVSESPAKSSARPGGQTQ